MSLDNLNLDIRSFLLAATIISFAGFVLVFLQGFRLIRGSGSLPYFRIRRQQLVRGWRFLGLSVFLGIFSVLINVYGEPIVYRYIDVTATPSPVPTQTLIPTITLTPTLTLTPSITPTLEFTYTPTYTQTPHIPLSILSRFESVVTPSVEIVFSELVFSKGYTDEYLPIQPGVVFQNPVEHLYALFSYDSMAEGVQWTALWYREGELVYFETKLWDGATGGFGFTDRDPPAEDWQPGNYEVQIFVGLVWRVVGFFTVEGDPPTSTATVILTETQTSASTTTPVFSPSPTNTPEP